MEARVAVLEQIAGDNRETFRDIRDMFQRMDAKMDAGFAKLDAKIDGVRDDLDTKIESIRDKQERDFRLLFGALIATALGLGSMMLGLAGLMAHGFKWIP